MTPGCSLEECKQEHLAMLHPSFLHPPAPEAAVPDSYDGMTIFCEGEGSVVSVIAKVLEPQRVLASI